MKVLVTGGAGFIGSVLVELLLQHNHHVTVLDNLLYRQHTLLSHFINPYFEFIHGDIRDAKTVQDAVRGVDAIVHLAAIVGAPACNKNPQLAEEVNVAGTKNLLDATAPEQWLLYGSTGSNYGKVDSICTEETPLNPLSIYGITKTRAEELVMARGNGICYRFATGFGLSPRLRLDLLPNDYAFQAVKNGTLIVYERHMKRTFIHVRDMARAFLHGLEQFETMKNNVYNVGSNTMNYSKQDLAHVLLRHVDYYLHFAEVGTDPDKRDYEVSYDKIAKTGFTTQVDMERGIIELVKGMRTVSGFNPYINVIH
ncbi:epimerase [Candidatus Uhrbacteria bacterium RIFCSPLOWO2_02_FULL_51_9]|uniref:Epimerase n=1 Tax=Candidatus Uhrbacteria bacterium RIFCSPLOWO2_02_FULL_51_9 TaxID=1802410 RepID=A0A1F7VFY5_9BACT|nr:MAG: epimerase [Candidatus Uhrbacteria bacterium RIFCSPLOWO2_02_FULL_51_9]